VGVIIPAKVFCIGANKTGTTSLERALTDMGYRLGDQAGGELLLRDWIKRDFRRIIHLCSTADAFQDVPFSLPYTYQAVDQAFPGSRFVLSVRRSGEEWYQSLVRFHTRIVAKGRQPTAGDLKQFAYRYPGYLWEVQQHLFGIREGQEYNRRIYIEQYERHNEDVRRYFRFRGDSLLVVDLASADAMLSLCRFLGVDHRGQTMPHINRSR
jgi:hypothetical protein